MKAGGKVRRRAWSYPGLWIALSHINDAHNTPHIYIHYPTDLASNSGTSVTWHARSSDLLGEDWEQVG
jgi:hypothetical protein